MNAATFRVGGHLGTTIYLKLGERREDDVELGELHEQEMARLAVACLNAGKLPRGSVLRALAEGSAARAARLALLAAR